MREILKEYNVKTAENVNRALKDLFGGLLQEAPEAELDTELGCGKNGQKPEGTGNRNNGYTEKSVRTEHRELELAVPRDRTGALNPLISRSTTKRSPACHSLQSQIPADRIE
jgi:transposase-like protein